MQKKLKKEKWTKQELELLAELYPLHNSKKWKKISNVFRHKGFERTEIQCRQKWINCLDPDLNNNEWTQEQLAKMYQIHEQVGTKWCVIQKYIGRTQNKIKNRFYGTLRNYVRCVINYLEQNERSYNNEVSRLSPRFLNNIYRAQNQFSFLKEQVKEVIHIMRFKINRTILQQRIKQKSQLYSRLKIVILKSFECQRLAKNSTEIIQKEVKIQNLEKQQQNHLQLNKHKIQQVSHPREQFRISNLKQQNISYHPNYFPFWNYSYQHYGIQYQ